MSWLRDGLESREPFDDLEDLRARGFVDVDLQDVMRCGTPERQGFGHDCDGWAQVGDPDGEAPCCGTCGCPIEEGEPEVVHTLTVNRDVLVAELERVLNGRRLRDGVAWSVEGKQEDVLVVVADWSDGTRWMTNRVLMGRPFVLVQVDEVVTVSRLGHEDWVVTVSLMDVLRQPTRMSNAVRRAESLAEVPKVGPAVTELHRLRSVVVHEVRGAHLVELRERDLVVDDVVVPLSPQMRLVVGFLVDRHLDDVRDGKAPEDFCWWSLEEMASELHLSRSAIRSQLNRLRGRVSTHFRNIAKTPLASPVVVWNDSRYRVSERVLLVSTV